jgi:trimeric autotransporter adhesin
MKLQIFSILTLLGTCKAVTVSPGDTVIAQIATGGTWKTSIQLINMGTKPAQYTISFYDDLGAAQPLTIVGSGRSTSVNGALAVGASRTIEIEEPGNNVIQGWGWMQTTDSIGGQVVFRQRVPGSPDFEGAVPLSSQSDRHFFMPFDQTNGAISAYAMANTSPGTQQVFITFRDESGNELRRATINFGGLSHQALTLKQFPELDGRRGYAEVTVPFTGVPAGIDTSVAIMGLRFNPNGQFSTSFPLILQSDKPF